MEDVLTKAQTIKFFNSRYAIVDHDGAVDIIEFGEKKVNFCSVQSRRTFWAFMTTQVSRGATDNSFDFWLESPKAHRRRGLVFDPSREPEKFGKVLPIDEPFNLFRGWGVTPKKGNCQNFLNHIKDVICAGDEDLYHYLVHYLGHLFQKPQELPEIAIVLRGGQGIGKGFFVNNICRLLHPMHFLHITSNKLLTGRFNEHFTGKLIIFADEAFWAGDKNAEGQLKAFITESNLALEPKYRSVFMVENKIRLFIASNERWVIPAGLDDRRYCFLDVSEIRKTDCKENREYFKRLKKDLDSGGLEALLHYFLNEVDLTDFEVRDVPKTPGLVDQKIESAGTVFKFWYEQVLENPGLFEKCENAGFISKLEVYGQYNMANLQTKRRHPKSAFWRLTRNLFPVEEGPKVTNNGKRIVTVVLPSHKKVKKSLFAILGKNQNI